ncbi:hypothetical protein EBR66_06580 [bacterium]|nr:hypothetical protein [bacterium]
MSRTFTEDYANGVSQQHKNQRRITKLMGCPMKATENNFHPMDFVDEDDDKHFGEHKWRGNISYDTLLNKCGGTVWIGLNKINYLRENRGRATFFWELSDGLYKADYDEEFHTFPTQFHARNRPDKSNDASWVVDVPLTKLVKV